MRPVILFAFVLDVVTVAIIALLLWRRLIPPEVGAGLMGAVIGARARWNSDHDGGSGGSGQTTRRDHLQHPPNLGGRADHMAREVLDASWLGPFVRVVL